MTHTQTYSAEKWVCGDGSVLLLEATIEFYVSPDRVTLVDAKKVVTATRVEYWQRTALIDWVACHQQFLRIQHDQRAHERRMAELV